jgi:pilus assembly protein CpaF
MYHFALHMFTVVITEKEGSERRLTFTEPEVTIGRVPGNDVVLPKGNVSKRHSRIVLKDNRFIVVDLKSTNGTYVNGRKITSPLVVKEGDKIYVGDFVLTLEGDPSAAALPASMRQPSLMPEIGDEALNNPPSLPPSMPPPLPSRAPEPMGDDVPAVLRAPTMSMAPVNPGGKESGRPGTSDPAAAPTATSDKPAVEQTNVVSYSGRASAPVPESVASRSVPPVLAVESSMPPPPAPPAMAPVRALPVRREAGSSNPVDALLEDPSVFHVLVERFDRIYVDRGDGLTQHSAFFSSPEALLALMRKLCTDAGVEPSSRASYDLTLPSGLHVVAVFPAAATDGPLLSLRRRPEHAGSLTELTSALLLDGSQAQSLENALAQRRPIWVVGAPGSDLSGIVAALIATLPAPERVALFERAPEVALSGRSAVCLKIGGEELAALLERARHFRPDRLVMHDLREDDLKPALLAFARRHDGSIGSIEHRSAKEALAAFDRSVGPDTVLRAASLLVEVARTESGTTRVTGVHQIELDASGDLTLKAV